MNNQDNEPYSEVSLASQSEDKEFRIIFDLTQDLVKDAILAFRQMEGAGQIL